MTEATSNNATLSRGYLVAIFSALILSTTAIFIRYLTQTFQLPSLILACLRDGLVSLTLLPILALLRPGLISVKPRHLAYLAVYGLVQAVFNATWTLSVAWNGAAVSTVLVYCSAGFTALLGWWLLKERLDWAKILVVCLSLGGCLLVSGALSSASWQANLVGISTGILSGLFYAMYSLMGRSAAQRGLHPLTTLLYTFAFAAIYLLGMNLIPGGHLPGAAAHPADFFWLGRSITGWGVLFLLAAGPTLAGFALYNYSLSQLPSSVANLIMTSEPVFTAVIAYLFLGELMNGTQVAGGLMILSGVVFLRIYEGWWAGQPQPAQG